MEAPLKPVELFDGIRKRCREVGSRFAVQCLGLDETGTYRRIPKSPPQVPSGLCVIVRSLATGWVAARNCHLRSRAALMITFGLASTR
jgi:hypothetical protein